MLNLKVGPSPKYLDCKTFLVEFDLPFELKKTFDFEDKKLYLKEEFHLTLIGNDDSKLLRERFIELFGEDNLEKMYSEMENEVKELIKEIKIDFLKKYYVIMRKYPEEEKARISLIQLVKTDLMTKFKNFIQSKYNFSLQNFSSLPHVTLYKEEDNYGIGLYSLEDLKKYSLKELITLN